MLVSAFITKLRQFVKDHEILARDKWDGDGTTAAFRTKHYPVTEKGHTMKVAGTEKTETTHYTLDKDTGLAEFTAGNIPAAADDTVTLAYYYAVLRDSEWLDVINNVLREWREKIWEEGIDEDTFTTVKNQDDYDMDDISPLIFKVLDVFFRTASGDNNYWVNANRDMNIRYMKEQNKVNFRPPFDTAGYGMRIRYLKSYDEVVNTSDTFTMPSKYHNAFMYACAAEYLDRFILKVIQDQGAKVQESTYKSLEVIRRVRDGYAKEAEKRLSRVKPTMSSSTIATVILGLKG